MTQKPHITLIAAMDANRLIGRDTGMPWYLPEDLKHFKARTLGKPIIMGRRTFDSIGKALPGRFTIVLSRTNETRYKGCPVAADMQQALAFAKEFIHQTETANDCQHPEVIIAGGGEIYIQALPIADRMVITTIHAEFEGDTHFPQWNELEWHLEAEQRQTQCAAPNLSYSFLEYRRIKPSSRTSSAA